MTEKSTPRSVACPTCKKAVPWSEASPWRPFCSERCRMIDLGEWLSEEKSIAGEPQPPIARLAPFVGPQTAWGWIGVVPLVTGAIGSCPVYSLFGINTCGLKD